MLHGLRPEAGADADGSLRDLLGPAHPGIEARLVALIGHEAEHLFHRPVDEDHLRYGPSGSHLPPAALASPLHPLADRVGMSVLHLFWRFAPPPRSTLFPCGLA